MAYQSSLEGRIFWPSANSEFTGCRYTGAITRPLKQAMKNRYMRRVQRSSKRDKLCAVYETSIPNFGHPLRFKSHGLGPVIKVRSPKVRRGGKVTGGQNLSLKRFDPQEVQKLQNEIRTIRTCMAKHPLTHPSGVQFSMITRIFNNASIKQGGRSYGSYQNYSESERLTMSIDGEPVCEIDIKSCYLAIIAGRAKIRLPDDPYSALPYVLKHADTASEPYKQARNLMKLMVSKLLSVDGKPSTFPQGEKVKMANGETKTLTVKQKYNVSKKVTAKGLYDEIYETYPFLRTNSHNVFELMHTESNIMTSTLHQLALKDVPAYPVHDCLICKVSDKERVLEALKENLIFYLGSVPALDVTYPDGTCNIYKAEYPEHYIPCLGREEAILSQQDEADFIDDDYSVIEEYFDHEGEEGKGIEEGNYMRESPDTENMLCPYYESRTRPMSSELGRMQAHGGGIVWVCTLKTSPNTRTLFPYQPKCGGCTEKCDFDAFGQSEQ